MAAAKTRRLWFAAPFMSRDVGVSLARQALVPSWKAKRDLRIYVDLDSGAVESGYLSAHALLEFHRCGFAVYNVPRLHAKLVVTDTKAYVGSGNLTASGLLKDGNKEFGVFLSGRGEVAGCARYLSSLVETEREPESQSRLEQLAEDHPGPREGVELEPNYRAFKKSASSDFKVPAQVGLLVTDVMTLYLASDGRTPEAGERRWRTASTQHRNALRQLGAHRKGEVELHFLSWHGGEMFWLGHMRIRLPSALSDDGGTITGIRGRASRHFAAKIPPQAWKTIGGEAYSHQAAGGLRPLTTEAAKKLIGLTSTSTS